MVKGDEVEKVRLDCSGVDTRFSQAMKSPFLSLPDTGIFVLALFPRLPIRLRNRSGRSRLFGEEASSSDFVVLDLGCGVELSVTSFGSIGSGVFLGFVETEGGCFLAEGVSGLEGVSFSWTAGGVDLLGEVGGGAALADLSGVADTSELVEVSFSGVLSGVFLGFSLTAGGGDFIGFFEVGGGGDLIGFESTSVDKTF